MAYGRRLASCSQNIKRNGKKSSTHSRMLLLPFRNSLKSAILNFMRLALFVSILSSILALNAETIQGKVVRVADGDTITILDGARITAEEKELLP